MKLGSAEAAHSAINNLHGSQTMPVSSASLLDTSGFDSSPRRTDIILLCIIDTTLFYALESTR